MSQQNNQPLVSIVMPVYNGEKYIVEALESVINQSYDDWELIIVNDCSTDSTGKVLADFAENDLRIRVIENKTNCGAAKSRNAAISESKGQYIAFIDSDDIWHEDKLEKQIAQATEANADILFCSYSLMSANGKNYKDFIAPPKTDFEKMLRENVIGCSTAVVRAELLKEHAFREDYYHEDYLLWLELLREGNIASGISDVLVDYRVSDTSRSGNKFHSAKERWKIYRNALKMDTFESCVCFLSYANNGVKKYFLG